ncbi:MAG TPA: hypothetical protein PK395_19190 [bacterium]|nr:hypothetical protein [bacterium]
MVSQDRVPNPIREDSHPPLRRKGRTLGSLVAGFKSAVTTRINQIRNTPGCPVWQRNYYEHVIRSERDLNHLREYIAANPFRWCEDEENPGTDSVTP